MKEKEKIYLLPEIEKEYQSIPKAEYDALMHQIDKDLLIYYEYGHLELSTTLHNVQPLSR